MLAARLKTDTRAAHDAAEASPSMRVLMAPGLSLADYRDHLRGVLRFVAPVEARLAAVPGLAAAVPALDERLVKTSWLARDLDVLGAGPTPERTEAAPELDLAGALGTLYVVEGSTLGGRLIERHLARTLGLGPRTGAAYYHAYGEARGPMWTAFRDALDAYGAAHPAQADAVVRAADAAFLAFGDALAGDTVAA